MKKLAILLFTGCAIATTIAACGAAPVGDRLTAAGSPTIQPFFSEAIASFAPDKPLVDFQLDFQGSSDGAEKLCDDLADIAGSTRELNSKEREACISSGTETVKLPVARDAVVLFVNRDSNPKLSCLSLPQLYSLLGPESAGLNRAADASQIARGLGEREQVPITAFNVVGPLPSSGTVDLLVAQGITPFASARRAPAEIRPDYKSLASDAMIPSEVERNRNGLGFADYDKVASYRSNVRFLAIDSGRGCVKPSPATISDGSYAFARLQLVYVNLNSAAAKPSLKAFIDFIVQPENLVQAAKASGLPLDTEQNRQTRDAWAKASARIGS